LISIDVLDKLENEEETEKNLYPWKRAKKVAAMLSFLGKNYHGMQRNPGDTINTIEDELLAALCKSGAIDPEWEKVPQKSFFTRASRTDKGVSAARMVVSLKMLPDPGLVHQINSFLPPDIRLQAMVRATKNFNCQTIADGRTYLYILPTFAFSPRDKMLNLNWRCNDGTITAVNNVLQHYIGSHFFHNFTSGKLAMEASSRRFIQEFEVDKIFEKNGMEWAVVRVKGQSFMLHQIRKMIGLAIAIVRGFSDVEILETAWDKEMIDIPKAPGLGLMLDRIHYDRYNKRYAEDDGLHDDLDWAGQEKEVEKFKEECIFSDIIQTEIQEKSMVKWLEDVLPIHEFKEIENSEK